jgi:hypothetical protein
MTESLEPRIVSRPSPATQPYRSALQRFLKKQGGTPPMPPVKGLRPLYPRDCPSSDESSGAASSVLSLEDGPSITRTPLLSSFIPLIQAIPLSEVGEGERGGEVSSLTSVALHPSIVASWVDEESGSAEGAAPLPGSLRGVPSEFLSLSTRAQQRDSDAQPCSVANSRILTRSVVPGPARISRQFWVRRTT